ncbi:MAG TPA: FKBP-type peptidyl-prolyl cis-trans isomerase [Verrucomicrobiae bacterium]
MRIGLGLIFAAGLGFTIAQAPARAADDQPAFKDDKEKASYAVGTSFGNMIKRSGMELDLDVAMAAMKDFLAGKEMRLTDMQVQETLRNYQMEARRKTAEKNKKEGAAFLAENKGKPGVKTLTVALSETNKVDLQYKVVTEGTGNKPGSNDTVTVKYRGTLIGGKEFDNSEKRGQPAKFRVNGVIKGWTAALEQMKVGSKWEVFIPSELAYGDMGNPNIEPGSTLIFDVELLGTEPPAAVAPPQPLTSDIIKVPSAEELKKGAKIEVIKPEDAAKMAQEEQKKKAEKK